MSSARPEKRRRPPLCSLLEETGFKLPVPLQEIHIALGVKPETIDAMLDKAKAEGREVRGPVDHRFVRSIYFRDPNGYVIELTASTGKPGEIMNPAMTAVNNPIAGGVSHGWIAAS